MCIRDSNRSVWTNNIDELAWSVLDLRVQETQVAREHPQGAELWHEKWPLDTILDALKEAYDPQRFDMGHEKWYKWIRDNKPHLEVDYLRLEDKLNEARIKYGEPPAQHHKDILKELQGMLTATGNVHRRESANMEFQEALNKACLADSEYHRSLSVKCSDSRLAGAEIQERSSSAQARSRGGRLRPQSSRFEER